MSLAQKFREKADQYEILSVHAASVVMRAWYESLNRSYLFLADDEDRYYSDAGLPMVQAGSMQPSPHDMKALDELEAELAMHVAKRSEDEKLLVE